MLVQLVAVCSPGSLGDYVRRALERLGHETDVFDYRDKLREKLRYYHKPVMRKFYKGMGAYERHIGNMNGDLKNHIAERKPDAVIVIKGELIYPDTVAEIARSKVSALAVWHPDNPFSVLSSTANVVYSLSCYDKCFVFDPYYISAMERAGAQEVHYLAFGCDPSIHTPMQLTDDEEVKYKYDVVFIGNYQSKYLRRSRLISHLADNFDMAIWGKGWHKAENERVRKCWMGRGATGEEMAKIYSASRVSVNVHHEQSVRGTNMRSFEATACGGVLLTDYVSELDSLFNINEELVCFADENDLISKIEECLSDDEFLHSLSTRAKQKSHESHDYLFRVKEMIDKMLQEKQREGRSSNSFSH